MAAATLPGSAGAEVSTTSRYGLVSAFWLWNRFLVLTCTPEPQAIRATEIPVPIPTAEPEGSRLRGDPTARPRDAILRVVATAATRLLAYFVSGWHTTFLMTAAKWNVPEMIPQLRQLYERHKADLATPEPSDAPRMLT